MKKKVFVYLLAIVVSVALIVLSPMLLYPVSTYFSEKNFARSALPIYLKYEKVILSKASYGFTGYCEVALYEANEVGLNLIKTRNYQAPFFRASNVEPLPDSAHYLIEGAIYCFENIYSRKIVMQLVDNIKENRIDYFYLYSRTSSRIRIIIPSTNKILHLGYNG